MNACGCVTGPPLGGKCACGAVCPTLCRQGTTTPTTVIHDLVTKILDDDVQQLSPLAATKALLAASAKAAQDMDLLKNLLKEALYYMENSPDKGHTKWRCTVDNLGRWPVCLCGRDDFLHRARKALHEEAQRS